MIVACVGFCALAAVVASARGAASGVVFTSLPRSVFEGQKALFGVRVANASRCMLALTYPGGRTDSFTDVPRRGVSSWSVRIPAVPPGRARAVVSCGSAGSTGATLEIKWAVQAPAIAIDKRGFTQRLDRYDTGSSAGWGAAVRNERARSDASDVSLLVNFVDSANKVLGSTHATVPRIPADSTFYVGGQARLDTQEAVARIEIIINATSSPPQQGAPPLVSDVATVPGSDGYLWSLRGQILNHYRLPLQLATVGAVIVDANGNILGGGFGYASGPVSYGAREYFSLGTTFSSIPVAASSGALVSSVGTFPSSP